MKFNERIKQFIIEMDGPTLADLRSVDFKKLFKQFGLSERAKSSALELVTINVNKFDKMWKELDPFFFILVLKKVPKNNMERL